MKVNKYTIYFSIFLFQTFKPIAVAEYPRKPKTISVEIPYSENITAIQNAVKLAILLSSKVPFGASVSYIIFFIW